MVNIRDCLTLKACRVIAGIKAEEIASVVGVSADTVYAWEKGRSIPDAVQMRQIVNCYAKKGYVVDINDINFFTN